MILGLTGPCCSGKNVVADWLTNRGWLCIDVDSLGHQALASVLPEVCTLLGPEARTADGRPDRRFIGGKVFGNPALMQAYEALVHPAMHALLDREIATALPEQPRICLNAAILYRMPQADRCQLIIEVRAWWWLRLLRARRRDQAAWPLLVRRLRQQVPLFRLRRHWTEKIRYVDNNTSRRFLSKQLERLDLPPEELLS